MQKNTNHITKKKKKPQTSKKHRKKYRQHIRYVPFNYNVFSEQNFSKNSPKFKTLNENERKMSYVLSDSYEISEIYVTGWEKVKESSHNKGVYYVFIIEYIRFDEIFYTKRSFIEFVELFKSL